MKRFTRIISKLFLISLAAIVIFYLGKGFFTRNMGDVPWRSVTNYLWAVFGASLVALILTRKSRMKELEEEQAKADRDKEYAKLLEPEGVRRYLEKIRDEGDGNSSRNAASMLHQLKQVEVRRGRLEELITLNGMKGIQDGIDSLPKMVLEEVSDNCRAAINQYIATPDNSMFLTFSEVAIEKNNEKLRMLDDLLSSLACEASGVDFNGIEVEAEEGSEMIMRQLIGVMRDSQSSPSVY